MAKVPTYQQSTTFTGANVGVVIPRPNTEIWEKIGEIGFKAAGEIAAEEGKAQGIKDQMANPGEYQPNALNKLFVGGAAYEEGRKTQYAVQKQLEWNTAIGGLEQQHHADPAAFEKAYNEQKSKFLNSVPIALQPGFAQYVDREMVTSMNKLRGQEFVRGQAEHLASYMTQIEQLRSNAYNGVVTGDDSSRIDTAMQGASNLVAAGLKQGYLTPAQARKDLQEFGHTIRLGEIEKSFRGQGSVVEKEKFIDQVRTASLNELGYKGQPLDPEVRLKVVHRLEAELATDRRRLREGLANEQGAVTRMFNDEVSRRLEAGEGIGLTEERIRRAFPDDPTRADEMVNKMRGATAHYTTMQNSAFTPPSEDAGLLAKLYPRKVEGGPEANAGYADSLAYYQHAQRAIAQKYEQIKQDPAGYVTTMSPEARRLAASNDPQERQSGMGMIDSLQARLGIPPAERLLLTKDQAGLAVKELESKFADPEQTADAVQAMAVQYGPYWNRVYAQLVDKKLPEPYQILGLLDQPGDAVTRKNYASAVISGQKALKDTLDPQTAKDVEKGVRDGLVNFSRTTRAAGGNDRLASMMQNGAETLGMYYANRGMSGIEAARKATSELTARWEFADTFRTPKGKMGEAALTTQILVQALTPDQLVPAKLRDGEALTDEQRQRVQLENARRGRWVNNETGDGLVLLYPNGNAVMKKDGRVEIRFDDMHKVQVPTTPSLWEMENPGMMKLTPETASKSGVTVIR